MYDSAVALDSWCYSIQYFISTNYKTFPECKLGRFGISYPVLLGQRWSWSIISRRGRSSVQAPAINIIVSCTRFPVWKEEEVAFVVKLNISTSRKKYRESTGLVWNISFVVLKNFLSLEFSEIMEGRGPPTPFNTTSVWWIRSIDDTVISPRLRAKWTNKTREEIKNDYSFNTQRRVKATFSEGEERKLNFTSWRRKFFPLKIRIF